MKPQPDLTPLQEFLTLDICPMDLAEQLDELAYCYSRLVISVQQTEQAEQYGIYKNTTEHLFYLRTLRDVLMKCEKGV